MAFKANIHRQLLWSRKWSHCKELDFQFISTSWLSKMCISTQIYTILSQGSIRNYLETDVMLTIHQLCPSNRYGVFRDEKIPFIFYYFFKILGFSYQIHHENSWRPVGVSYYRIPDLSQSLPNLLAHFIFQISFKKRSWGDAERMTCIESHSKTQVLRSEK